MKVYWLSVLLFSTSAYAQIYKWVDADGVVHYGDEPVSNQVKPMKDLPDLSTYSPRRIISKPIRRMRTEERVGATKQSRLDKAHAMRDPSVAGTYDEIVIVSPEEGATIKTPPGQLSIFLALDPVLKKDDYIQVSLDGKTMAQRFTSTFLRIPKPSKGEHQLQILVVGSTGKLLSQSEVRSFHVR